MNTQHCCGHDRLKANMNRPDQSDWAKRWNSSGFVHSLGSCHENHINLVIYTVYCILLVRPHVPAISLIERPIMWYLSPLPMRGMTLYDHVDTFVRIRAMSDNVAGNDGWFIPQIALAIGVLTSNRRGVGYQLWRSSCWVPLVGCHGRVPLVRCHGRVPLLGATILRAPFSTLITHKLVCAIWGLCGYNVYLQSLWITGFPGVVKYLVSSDV